MNKFVIEIKPFPHIMGKDEIVVVETDKNIDMTLELMQNQLKINNPMFDYDLYGWESVESYISSIPKYNVDK